MIKILAFNARIYRLVSHRPATLKPLHPDKPTPTLSNQTLSRVLLTDHHITTDIGSSYTFTTQASLPCLRPYAHDC